MISITRIMDPVNRVEDLREPMFVGEAYAHMFTILPMKGETFEGAGILARVVRSDNQEVYPVGLLDPETSNIVVVLSPECYAVSGSFSLYVYAILASETMCVYACNGTVLPSISGDSVASELPNPIIEAYHDPALTALQAAVQTLEGTSATTQEALAALQTAVSEIPFKRSADGGAVFGDNDGVANGQYAVAIGEDTWATGPDSVAAGYKAQANGDYSAAFGNMSEANGPQTFAMGLGTTAKKRSQLVFGEYNAIDPSPNAWDSRGNYVEIVGNGTGASSSLRHNARTLDWNGNEALAGGLTLGKGSANEVTITASQLRALLALLG